MLRITVERQPDSTVFKLEGRISGEWVEELRTAYASSSRIVLVLTDVSGADAEGLALLSELHSRGAELTGAGLGARTLIDKVSRTIHSP